MWRFRLVVVMLLPSIAAAGTIYVAPDVATDLDGPATYLPWQVVEHPSAGPNVYALELTIPGDPAIDALHKMDMTGHWLFSVESPSNLTGLLEVAPEDVVLWSAGTPSLFFDGSCVALPLPGSASVDAVYLDGGDGGDLIVSLDVPVTLSGSTYLPSALLRYEHVAAGPCGWSLVGQEIDFRNAPTTTFFPRAANVIGADRVAGKWIVSVDIPIDLGPSVGPTTYLPGQVASFDGTTWDLFADLPSVGTPGWPVTSQVSALSCQAGPGRIGPGASGIILDRLGAQIEIACPASCASGAEAYGVYEGTLASLRLGAYDHVRIDCLGSCPVSIPVVPGAGDRYYLVVPHNEKEEGSYGALKIAGTTTDRPPASAMLDRCAPAQNLDPCP